MELLDRHQRGLHELGAVLRALVVAPMVGASVGVVIVLLVPLWDRSFDPAEILLWCTALGVVAGVLAAPIAWSREREADDLHERA